MNTSKKTSNPAPLAHRVPAEVSDLINTYAAFLTEQTGHKVDPMSVYLGSQLRSTFQKGEANQARIAQAAKHRAALDAAKATAKAAREAAGAAKAAEPKTDKPAPKATPKADAKKPATPARRRPTNAGATIATSERVVIAEQRHIDATKAVQA